MNLLNIAWLTCVLVLSSQTAEAGTVVEIDNGGDIVILVNADNPPQDLGIGSLRAIFSLRKRAWPDETPITVVVLPDKDPLHQKFCKSVLKIYPFVLREQWDRLIFSGIGTPPTVAKDQSSLREIIASTPGAIGYSTKHFDTATSAQPIGKQSYETALGHDGSTGEETSL